MSIVPIMFHYDYIPCTPYERYARTPELPELTYADTTSREVSNAWRDAEIAFLKSKIDKIKESINHEPIKFYPNDNRPNSIYIKDVRFSPPATIVFWSDNTKTVVKAQNGEPFDAEKGLMACIIKRITGNTGRYNELFKKYIKENK